jgi:tetratricopeptide (TPR) repeat protein
VDDHALGQRGHAQPEDRASGGSLELGDLESKQIVDSQSADRRQPSRPTSERAQDQHRLGHVRDDRARRRAGGPKRRNLDRPDRVPVDQQVVDREVDEVGDDADPQGRARITAGIDDQRSGSRDVDRRKAEEEHEHVLGRERRDLGALVRGHEVGDPTSAEHAGQPDREPEHGREPQQGPSDRAGADMITGPDVAGDQGDRTDHRAEEDREHGPQHRSADLHAGQRGLAVATKHHAIGQEHDRLQQAGQHRRTREAQDLARDRTRFDGVAHGDGACTKTGCERMGPRGSGAGWSGGRHTIRGTLGPAMEIGRVLRERYEIERELGRGGMGAVFAGRDHVLGREVAIKVIANLADREQLELGLAREAKLIAGLDHPNIVPVFDFGRDGELLFLIMPLVRGRTLRELLRDGPLALPVVAEIARQVALGLAHSHAQGVVHRDIKPENLMLTSDPSGLQVKIMDFGVALSGVGPGSNRGSNDEAPWLGTLRYLAPEQVRGETLDARGDLHGLGLVIHEALVGRPAFVEESRAALLEAIQHATPVRARLLRDDLPAAFDPLLQALLAKRPEDRPGSALEVAARLAEFTDARAAWTLLDPRAAQGVPAAAQAQTASLRGAIGREPVLRAIESRLSAARAGSLQLALLAGSLGIGKTLIVDELALLCRRRGVTILRSSPGEADSAARLVDVLDTMLAEHGRTTDVVASPEQGEPVSERERLLIRLRALSKISGPLVLAIDDLHLGTELAELVELMFSKLGDAAMLIVAVHELDPLPTDHLLRRLHLRLAEHPRALVLELGPLPASVHDELIVQLLGGGEPEPGLAERLRRESGGRPLFARELIRAAVETGVLVQRDRTWRLDAGEWPIPRNLRTAIGTRLRSLPESMRALLRLAAVLAAGDGGFEFDELTELHGGVSYEIELMVERAIELGLLGSQLDARARLSFSSELLRRIVHAELPVAARQRLHRHRAERLRRGASARPGARADESDDALDEAVLAHLLEAEAHAEALPFVLALARRALDELRPGLARPALAALLSAGEALARIERAELRLLAAELDALRGEEHAVVSGLQALALELDEGFAADDDPRLRRLGERGAELARAHSRVELADRLLGLRTRGRRVSERERRARTELAALRPATSSRSMAVGDLLLMHGEYTAAREAYEAARRRAAAEGRRDEEARQLQKLARVASKLGLYDSALGYCREGLESLDGAHSLERVGLWALAAYVHCFAGHFERAAAELEAGSAELASFPDDGRDPAYSRVASELARSRGNWLIARGRPDQAVVAFERCLELAAGADRWVASIAHFNLGEACALAGLHHRALRELERAAADKRALGDRWGLAHTHAVHARVLRDLGMIHEGTAPLTEARELANEVDDPRLFAQVHLELGRHQLLTGAVAQAEADATRAHDVARSCSALIELAESRELLAALALVRGDHIGARAHAEAALASAEQHGLGGVLVGALLMLAESLVERPLERKLALERAHAAAEELGNPHRELDVELTRLRLQIRGGESHDAGDDYVALERLIERAEGLPAARHVGLCLLAQAEVLRPHDLRGAIDHARVAESRLRGLGAVREADQAHALLDRLEDRRH